MVWRDSQGTRWLGRRRDGWPNDDKAPDGYTVAGFRRIDKKGRIRFGGTYWTHDRLKESPGRWVRVCWGGRPGTHEERASVYFGNIEATPENYSDHHGSFYEWRNMVYCDGCGDWAKRISAQ